MRNWITYLVLTVSIFALLITANIVAGGVYVGTAMAEDVSDDGTSEKTFKIVISTDCHGSDSDSASAHGSLKIDPSFMGITGTEVKVCMELTESAARIEITSSDPDAMTKLHDEADRFISGEFPEDAVSLLGIKGLNELNPEIEIIENGVVIQMAPDDFHSIMVSNHADGDAGFNVESAHRILMLKAGGDCLSVGSPDLQGGICGDIIIGNGLLEGGEETGSRTVVIRKISDSESEPVYNIVGDISDNLEIEDLFVSKNQDGIQTIIINGDCSVVEGDQLGQCEATMEGNTWIIKIIQANGEEKIIEFDISGLCSPDSSEAEESVAQTEPGND